MGDDPDIDLGDANKQDGRAEPTSSSRDLGVDISDEETREKREQRQTNDYTVDDIQDPDLREKVREARQKDGKGDDYSDDEGGVKPVDDRPEPPEDDGNGQKVKVGEGESPLEGVAKNIEENEAKGDNISPEPDGDDDDDGLLSGVDDDDVDEAMDMDLNVREDIDPKHFDFEEQDFSHFGGYGDEAVIEYNDTMFLLTQAEGNTQEELINEMGTVDGMDMTGMMESMIDAMVARPENIEEITDDWTPFEKMGLGLQCMEFSGISSLGNM